MLIRTPFIPFLSRRLRAVIIDLPDAPLMPAAVKRCGQPQFHDFQRGIERDEPLSERKDIRIVVRAGIPGGFGTPAQRAAHAFYTVGDNRLTVPGTAEHDSPLRFPFCHSFRGGPNISREVDGFFRIGAKIQNLMSFAL